MQACVALASDTTGLHPRPPPPPPRLPTGWADSLPVSSQGQAAREGTGDCGGEAEPLGHVETSSHWLEGFRP